jgi:hypothetical protein
MEGFIDENCIFEFEGTKFESGGAFLAKRVDNGKYVGQVYAQWDKQEVRNWHGDIKIPAFYGPEYRSNMGDLRQSVYFHYQGKLLFGTWYSKEWNQLVRVKEVRG